MAQDNLKNNIFVTSLILTISLFMVGILLNYVLDFYRIDEISRVIENHKIDKTAYFMEEKFIDSIGLDKCAVMNKRFFDLKTDMHKVGIALTNYWGESAIKKIDFDYLKRHYFLLELEFYTLINKLNKECDTDYVTVLFFYEKDDQDSITYGYILEDISLSYKQNLVVLSLDKDYKDEILIPLVVKRFNITKAPVIVINNIKLDGIKYSGEINATIKEIIRNTTTDKYAQDYDHDYLFKKIGLNKTEYVKNIEDMLNNSNVSFIKAELLFLNGRLTKDINKICSSLQYYDKAALETDNEEMKAAIYETIASIGCGRNKKAFLELAAKSWKKVGNNKRAEIDIALFKDKALPIQFETSEIVSSQVIRTKEQEKIVLGESKLEITENSLILSQVDRVTRDWLGMQYDHPLSANILTTFSERLTYNQSELREDIGWHEGGIIKQLKNNNTTNILATATMVMKKGGKWYAPNENGIFMFEVPFDKIMYPTTRFLRNDIAIIIDTHGINMLVEQAMRTNASIIIGCCDHPGKIKAALYLSNKGKNIICTTDKYSYLALGKNSNILASPPIKIINATYKKNSNAKQIIIGNQPIKINLAETIIVTNATDLPYALWYYQTPANYFSELSKNIKLNLIYVTISNFSQMDKIVNTAINNNVRVIATRVFNSDDYYKLLSWLKLSKQNRAVLFHSSSYPYGKLILMEYPAQVTFGDVNVKFE